MSHRANDQIYKKPSVEILIWVFIQKHELNNEVILLN